MDITGVLYNWGEPGFNSHLTLTCHKLMKKAIGLFDIEDLRIMIGQKIGLCYLVPLALEIIEDDIYAEGDMYVGDLLDSVLSIDVEFWQDNPVLKSDIEQIIEKNIRELTNKLYTFRNKFNK